MLWLGLHASFGLPLKRESPVVLWVSLYLRWWPPLYLSQEAHINLLWEFRLLYKEATDPVEMKQGAPLEFQWGSLVVVEDSSLHVAWVFLSSCSVLVSSFPVSVGSPL